MQPREADHGCFCFETGLLNGLWKKGMVVFKCTKGHAAWAKQAAEKGIHSVRTQEKRTAGAEAHIDFAALAARLKSCPDTRR